MIAPSPPDCPRCHGTGLALVAEVPCLDPNHEMDEPDPFLGPERVDAFAQHSTLIRRRHECQARLVTAICECPASAAAKARREEYVREHVKTEQMSREFLVETSPQVGKLRRQMDAACLDMWIALGKPGDGASWRTNYLAIEALRDALEEFQWSGAFPGTGAPMCPRCRRTAKYGYHADTCRIGRALGGKLRPPPASVMAAAWELVRECWNDERGWVRGSSPGKMEALKVALEGATSPPLACERCDRPLGPENICPSCQLVHGEPCPRCGQRALHVVACQEAREHLVEVPFSPGDGTVQVLRVSRISGGFPRGADGTCAFCAGDPLGERSGNETLIGAFFLRVAQRHGEGDTCPCCSGKPT
jgi:hypothetical protein